MRPAASVRAGEERLHALDALRAFAMLLGVVYHVGIAYMVAAGADWPFATRRSFVFNLGFLAVHGFRMPLFFLVAGFFGRLLLGRLGAGGFVRHRARRIALPLALGMLTVAPLVNLTWNFSVNRSWPGALRWTRSHFIAGPDHLWFLYYLLIYYAATLLAAPTVGRLLPGSFQRWADRVFVRVVRGSLLPLVPVVITLIPLAFTSTGTEIGSPAFWAPVPRIVCYYAIFYGFGWCLHRNVSLLQELKRGWVGHVVMAAGWFALCVFFAFSRMDGHRWPFPWMKLGATIAYSGFTWSSIFACLIAFLRHLDRHSRLVRYGADASYWFYLVHLPVVLFLQAYLNASNLNVFVQFLAVLMATLLFCAVTYHYSVRFSWVGTLLNGRRQPRV